MSDGLMDRIHNQVNDKSRTELLLSSLLLVT